MQSKRLVNLLVGSLFLTGLSITEALFPEKVLAHIMCPFETPWPFETTEELCPHIHPQPPAESEVGCPECSPPPPVIPPVSQPCPASFSPASFQGLTGRVAFYNEWNAPVTVIVYHPNSYSVYDRYSVPPGQNQLLGNNIIVGDDWGICFENKPGASGFVNNLGTISDYNPNFQGSPLFMIQNGRIK